MFYDKIPDLNQSKGRAIDKDQTPMQFSIFDQITAKKQRSEVLRLEVRLSKRRKLKQVINMQDPKLCDVFNKELSRRVVQQYWQMVAADGRLLLITEDPFTLLDSILLHQPTIKPKQAVYLVGLGLLANAKGFRGIKDYLRTAGVKRTLQRVQKDFDVLKELSDVPKHSWLGQIGTCLEQFVPYKINKNK